MVTKINKHNIIIWNQIVSVKMFSDENLNVSLDIDRMKILLNERLVLHRSITTVLNLDFRRKKHLEAVYVNSCAHL